MCVCHYVFRYVCMFLIRSMYGSVNVTIYTCSSLCVFCVYVFHFVCVTSSVFVYVIMCVSISINNFLFRSGNRRSEYP